VNHAVAIDASVAAKWLLTEEYSGQARSLLRDSLRGGRPLVGPPLLMAEVINILYQRVRTKDPNKHITETEAEQALGQFLQYPLRLVAPDQIYSLAFAFARTQQLENTYDALYVVLAQLLNVELWTDDRVLLRSVSDVAPWVHWIRDYPLSH
jgi:predicted nucleic acid-binding protein